MSKNRVLYISHDGLADHIGQAQIVPYIQGLADRGFSITVVSAEKRNRQSEIDQIEVKLTAGGVRWHRVPYRNRPPIVSTLIVMGRLLWESRKCAGFPNFAVIHCRGFLAAMVGLYLKPKINAKLIFDFRDFWADRRIHSDRFKSVFRFIKRREGWLIKNSDHVVTLTHRAKEILIQSYLSGVPCAAERFTIIPTCVDLDLFDTTGSTVEERKDLKKSLGINPEAFILGYIGTVHADYLPNQMFRVFEQLKKLVPNSRFLFLSHTDQYIIRQWAEMSGSDPDSIVVRSVPRIEVPKYLSIFDLSIVFIRADKSTAGVSPTKLAELFACNVPVIANAGVGDMDNVLAPERNDSILMQGFQEGEISEALKQAIVLARRSVKIGRIAAESYSLREGINRYQSIYNRFIKVKTGGVE